VLARTYDLLLWFLPHLVKFPRAARFSVGERLADALLDAHAHLTDAAYNRDREHALAAAARAIDQARLLTRLAHDLRALDHRRYFYAGEKLVEIGRMIGGWRRQHSARR
jgi:hypothetical protein